MTTTEHTLSPDRAANLAENPHAGQGSVLLDIGGDIGAVVLRLPAAWEGAEVEYRRAGEDHGHDHSHGPEHSHGQGHSHPHPHGHRPHVAVVGRPSGRGVAYAAVFPELPSGRYVMTLPDQTELSVDVEGGAVTERSWLPDRTMR
jgi:hypothetical protein